MLKMKIVRKNTLIIIVFFWSLFFGLSANLKISEGSESIPKNKILLGNEYVDPKGFFKIRPPAGWQISEYIDDPRGKTDFNSSPNKPRAQLKIIGMASPFSNYEKFIHDSEMQCERLKSQYKQYNVSITTEKTTFADVPAFKVYFTIPNNLNQMTIGFLMGKNYYSLLFGAPPDLYKEFFSVAMISFESFEPILKNVTEDEVVKHNAQFKIEDCNARDSNGTERICTYYYKRGFTNRSKQ